MGSSNQESVTRSQGNGKWPSIAAIARDVASSSYSALDNVNKALKLIKDLDPEYQAIIAIITERALERAKLLMHWLPRVSKSVDLQASHLSRKITSWFSVRNNCR